MTEEEKDLLLTNMAENLPVLRAKIGITQAELAQIAGVNRQTILAVENKKRKMTWIMFLSMLYIFKKNRATAPMVKLLGLETDELNKFISK